MMIKSKEQSLVPTAQNGFSLISDEKLLALYATMLKCRMIQERAGILFQNNKSNGNADSAVGLEAAAAGVAIDLLPEDTVSTFPLDLIPLFIKGLPLEKLSARPFNAIAPSFTIATQLNIAAGTALANKAKKKQ
jgi:TPP-dependent pyruvate/acetoin dehydrogenase alpha subunit